MTDDKAREAIEHLQRAALEMIAAARAALDVAEELVRDPAPLVEMAANAAAAASVIKDATVGAAGRVAGAEPDGPRVEHIRVS